MPAPAPRTPPAAPPGPASRGGAASEEQAEYVRSRYTKFEYQIPMRDGVRLFTAVYVPNDAGPQKRYPIMMTRTPYSVAPYGVDRYSSSLMGPAFTKEGFIFVFQDVRGRNMSEGEFVNVRPQLGKKGPADPKAIDESTDTFDTIAWLLARVPDHNGKVGLKGISYPGFYASAGAIDSHPALKAVSPQAPIADWWRGDDMHRHGAFNVQLSFAFFSRFGLPRPKPTADEDRDPFPFGTPDAYQFYLRPLAELEPAYLKGQVSFWNEIAAHPDYDEFWQARNLLPHLRNIKAAMLVVGGWYDTEDLYGPLATYRAIEAQNRGITNTLVIGPWRHGGWARGDSSRLGDADFGFATAEPFQAKELAFFVHHLKGGPAPGLAEAMMFEAGADRWRSFDAWPPKATREARLYLQPGGGLAFDAPPAADASAGGFDEYPSDPARPVPYTQEVTQGWSANYAAEDQRFASRRPDVLVYQTPPLDRDVTLAGPLTAELFVSTTGTDADWVVKLIDVNPDTMPGWTELDERTGERPNLGAKQILVRGEPMRGRYRDGGATPKPFVPGETTPVTFPINDVFYTFGRGHRIMIQIQSSWFPFIDRNPQTFVPIFQAKAQDFVKATHRVHRAAATPSALVVRVLPAADE
ncbi:MAG: CocE/NonD family hydrolase [Myxococcales bacterium]|nr:CocE/NonD family hydrolase [Myxococcales bacterium]